MKMIITGGVLVLAGIAAPVIFFLVLMGQVASGEQFLAPGEYTMQAEPGRYMVWHDHRTVYDGVSYNKPAPLPDGAVVKVLVGDTPVPLVSYQSMSSTSGSKERASIGSFELPAGGSCTITVSGLAEQHVFSVGVATDLASIGLVVGATFLSSLLLIIGGVLIWVGFNRAGKRGRRSSATTGSDRPGLQGSPAGPDTHD